MIIECHSLFSTEYTMNHDKFRNQEKSQRDHNKERLIKNDKLSTNQHSSSSSSNVKLYCHPA